MQELMVEITVDGQPWQQVESLERAGPDDAVFVLDRSASAIRFGDGARGRRPPTGAPISASYRTGAGVAGNVSLTWTYDPAAAVIVQAHPDRVVFDVQPWKPRSWRSRLAFWLCALVKRWLRT